LDAIAGITSIAKELVKDTSMGMVAQSLQSAEIAIKQVQNATIKCEEAAIESQQVFDKAKVYIVMKNKLLHLHGQQ